MKKLKSMWHRMVDRLLSTPLRERPAIDPELNATRIGRVEVNDVTYNLALDFAYAEFANAMEAVLDLNAPAEKRLAAANGAAAIRNYLVTMEDHRQSWTAVRLEKEREEREKREEKSKT